jgi:predicted nucleotidyltransferase component of viral defense system
MPDLSTVEGLMIFLINTFSEKFPQSAILKGGMCLRLLDCPRLTNDIDYVFVPYRSKKDILQGVTDLLDDIDGLTYDYSMNSKCLRIRVQYGELSTQIEANVARECPATSVSTAAVSRQQGMLGRVVQVSNYDVSMANKLAAWNERALVRDLYDLYFLYAMVKAKPDMAVLEKRLAKVASTPRNKNPRCMTLEQLVTKLRKRLTELSDDDMLELSDYLPGNELQGLETKIRAQLLQFCDALEKAGGTNSKTGKKQARHIHGK